MNKDQVVKKVIDQVSRQYPEFNSVHPEIKWKKQPDDSPETCTLTFQTTVQTSTGKKIARRVKVVANMDGRILKITGSK